MGWLADFWAVDLGFILIFRALTLFVSATENLRPCLAAGFRPCGASHFLLLRQKKVSKEKATPGSAPGVARSLALLGRPGGLLNSPAAQTDASRNPPASLRCSAPLRGTRKASPPNWWRWFFAVS